MNGKDYGIEFYGTEGTLFVDRAGYEIRPEMKGRGENRAPRMAAAAEKAVDGADHPSHMRNFIDCVKSRQAPICDIEIGHRSSSTAILGNLALRSGPTVDWDAKAERVTNGNQKATELLTRAYRAPWSLTV